MRYGFKGPVYPINPGRPEVQGLKSYKSLDDLPEVPELAVCVVAGDQAVTAVEEAARKGVKGLILLFAFVMAFEQLGIGRSTVIAAFTIAFGGAVLALALAFGLGGKDLARTYLEKRFKKDGGAGPDGLRHL
jgi:acyl-CoA synthetase (NDP forming)